MLRKLGVRRCLKRNLRRKEISIETNVTERPESQLQKVVRCHTTCQRCGNFRAKNAWMAFPVPCSYIHEYASINGFHSDGGLGDVRNKSASMPREMNFANVH